MTACRWTPWPNRRSGFPSFWGAHEAVLRPASCVLRPAAQVRLAWTGCWRAEAQHGSDRFGPWSKTQDAGRRTQDVPAMITDADGYEVTPDLVLEAYRQRCFPMADEREGRLRWYRPAERAVITWDRWKVPESLVKVMRRAPFRLSVDEAF